MLVILDTVRREHRRAYSIYQEEIRRREIKKKEEEKERLRKVDEVKRMYVRASGG